jgi:F-type H+-transporting ATPase subunit b
MLKRMLMAMVLATGLLAVPVRLIAQEEHAAGAHAANAAQAAHGEHEKPPLLANPFGSDQYAREARMQSLWVVIIFVVLLIILYFTAWKNVLMGLKSREERIRKDIADAENARVKAEMLLRDYNAQLTSAEKKVQEMIAKAVADGEKVATSIKMSAQKEAEDAKERAQRDIEASKNQAIAEFLHYAVTLATDVASKILRRSINPEDQKDLVNRSLEQMQTLSKN